jgi:Uma2 family endonuclease
MQMVEQLTILTPPDARAAYLALPEGTRAELINDCIYMSPAPLLPHQIIIHYLDMILGNHVLEHKLGTVLPAPVDVHLNDSNIFQPDLVYVARERRSLLTRKGIMGAPDLVVEVLSPSNAYYDLTEKKRVYELAGVPYYWTLDPETSAFEGWMLEGATYAMEFRAVEQGTVQPRLFSGLVLPVQEIFDFGDLA